MPALVEIMKTHVNEICLGVKSSNKVDIPSCSSNYTSIYIQVNYNNK